MPYEENDKLKKIDWGKVSAASVAKRHLKRVQANEARAAEKKEKEKSKKDKESWLSKFWNSNPNRQKVKKITGAKGTRMFKPKKDKLERERSKTIEERQRKRLYER